MVDPIEQLTQMLNPPDLRGTLELRGGPYTVLIAFGLERNYLILDESLSMTIRPDKLLFL